MHQPAYEQMGLKCTENNLITRNILTLTKKDPNLSTISVFAFNKFRVFELGIFITG